LKSVVLVWDENGKPIKIPRNRSEGGTVGQPDDSDLLLPFEQRNLTGEYRAYYRCKRNAFFATIQDFPDLWDFFSKIDEIWKRDLSDLEVAHDPNHPLPLALYVHAHVKMRVSMELAFSHCMQEARSVLRDAVECVAHAHHMLRNPANLRAWEEKNQPGGLKAFKAAFENNKRTVLFQGIEDLYVKFGQLSEAGSHPTWQSFSNRLTYNKAGDERTMTLHYLGAPDRNFFAKELFSRLLTCFAMERTLFEDFKMRLQLDDRLMRMRCDFEIFKEQLRKQIIDKYKIKPPDMATQERPAS
jgi:hypothetical protein